MNIDNLLGSSKLNPYTLILRHDALLFSCSAKRTMIYAKRLKNLWMPEEFFSYSRRAIVTTYARVAQVFAKLITHIRGKCLS